MHNTSPSLAQDHLPLDLDQAIGLAMVRRAHIICKPTKPQSAGDWHQPLSNGNLAVAASRALADYAMGEVRQGGFRSSGGANGTWTICILGAMEYVIDPHRREVFWRSTVAPQRLLFAPWCALEPSVGPFTNIDLLNPLCRPAWLLEIVIQGHWLRRLAPEVTQALNTLLPDDDATDSFMEGVIAAAHRILWREPRFHQMRAALARAITRAIGSRVVDLAMRTRLLTDRWTLLGRHLNLTWQHQELYETVQQENPRLLRTVTAWLDVCVIPDADKPLHVQPAMRQAVLACGLPPRAWRYVCQHGIEKLVNDLGDSPWYRLMSTLHSLGRCGWPPPPPLRMLDTLSDVVEDLDPDSMEDDSAKAWLWKVVCTEAANAKSDTRTYTDLHDALPLWAWVMRHSGQRPDRNQQRHPIRWLQRTARALAPLYEGEDDEWSTWTHEVDWPALGSLGVVPLTSSRHLLEEAIALKNCADGYQARCRQGAYLMLSLREQLSGKRRALVGLAFYSGRWRFDNVAGPCNQQVSERVRLFAQRLAHVANQHGATHAAAQAV